MRYVVGFPVLWKCLRRCGVVELVVLILVVVVLVLVDASFP